MPKNLVVIFNPSAGARRRARLYSALDLLYGLGVQFQLLETSARGDAENFARRVAEESGIVVAAGGDGTIAEVAAGLAGSSATLGILPLGTANVFALEMAVPLNAREAARASHGPQHQRLSGYFEARCPEGPPVYPNGWRWVGFGCGPSLATWP